MQLALGEATWTDAAAADAAVALLPVGSTEQHGPHAPLATDTVTAAAVAEAGGEAASADTVVAPPLPYGVSGEHRHFPGTLWLSPDAFRDCIACLLGSLASHGWRRIVLVNGHGGNTPALREVAADTTRGGECYAVPFTWFDAVDPGDVDLGHAGAVETAMLREHRPDLVHEDRVDAARDGAADRWGEWLGAVDLAYDSAEFTANGVVGDPTAGDTALGEALTEQAGAALGDLVDEVADRDPGRPDPRTG